MINESTSPRVSGATWLGLFIAFFAMLIARQAVSFFFPTLTFTAALWKESLMWLSALALLIVVRKGERLPFGSIGIGTARWWRSIFWGLVIAIVCALVGGVLAHLTGYGHGSGSAAFEKLPLWLISLVTVRAGVVEELFYRGYAIERLKALGLNRYAAAALPLIIFGFGHWTGGWANIVIAFALGGVLAAFYLWRGDLVSNMIGHFAVDFAANVLPELFH